MHQLSISWIIVNIISVWLTFRDSNYKQRRVLNVSVETLHSSSNKLSAVCVAARAAGLRGCLPRWGSVRAVCNEPCYWSRRCGRNLSCGRCCVRDKAAGAESLSEKVCVKSARHFLASQCGMPKDCGCVLLPELLRCSYGCWAEEVSKCIISCSSPVFFFTFVFFNRSLGWRCHSSQIQECWYLQRVLFQMCPFYSLMRCLLVMWSIRTTSFYPWV